MKIGLIRRHVEAGAAMLTRKLFAAGSPRKWCSVTHLKAPAMAATATDVDAQGREQT